MCFELRILVDDLDKAFAVDDAASLFLPAEHKAAMMTKVMTVLLIGPRIRDCNII
jgi:hypothetical protein